MASFALKFATGGDQYTFTNVESFSDNFGDLVPATVRLPGQSGGFDMYGVEVAPNAIGTVQITTRVDAASTAMQTSLQNLRKLANLGLQKIYFQPEGTFNERYVYGRVQDISINQRAENSLVLQDVQITFECPDPFWRETEENTAIAASGTSTDGTVTNAGNATALARIKIVPGAGNTCENPTIRRIVSGSTVDQMTYTGTVSGTEELVLDAQKKAVTLDSADAFQGSHALTADWFRLLPGANTVRVVLANAGDAATVTVYYSDTYR